MQHMPQSTQKKLTPQQLVEAGKDLVSPPEIYNRLRSILDQPDWSPDQVEAVLQTDPGLTARLLRLVNSPFYGLMKPVDDISRAITILGVRELVDLVLTTTVIRNFRDIPSELFNVSMFWQNRLHAAVLGRVLAEAHPHKGALGPVFVSTLLSELGMLMLCQAVPEPFARSLQNSQRDGLSLEVEQRRMLGCDHYQVGLELARQWRLPELLQDVLQSRVDKAHVPQFNREVALIELAEMLHHGLHRQMPAASLEDLQVQTALWDRAGLSPEELKDILETADSQYESLLSIVLY